MKFTQDVSVEWIHQRNEVRFTGWDKFLFSGVGRILVRWEHLATKRLSRAPLRGPGGQQPPDVNEV